MPIVFRFDSMDSRERATFITETPEQAAQHVSKVLNQGRRRGPDLWTHDEDGTDIPRISDMIATLRAGCDIKLYDQSSMADHVVTIEPAFVRT
jgi:hypothetical protein